MNNTFNSSEYFFFTVRGVFNQNIKWFIYIIEMVHTIGQLKKSVVTETTASHICKLGGF